MPSTTLLLILQQLPQLLHVVAHLHDNNSSGPVTIAPSLLAPSLQSFILRGDCSNILEFLTLPGLRNLQINHADIDFCSCLEFFKRSACSLNYLAVRCDGGKLAACLDAIPTVTSLYIDGNCDMSLFARILTGTPLLVPRLSTLTLRLFRPKDYHLSLVDFLAERFARGLVSVKVHLDHMSSWLPPADCLAKLNELISGGMDVELRRAEQFWNGGDYCPQQSEPEGATQLLSDDLLLMHKLDPREKFP
ncbi:hypothetical protein GGX14DRAFT_578911 [Mycena pura]|uniref:Uncharacterized protein n=1 Tax=Mycena pura TaxID=153505 RepID=A0AAD6Y0V1_9AGAR|nr:hypothetical protein GGX14DRAFT_578911 [Mycena pura]